MKRSEAPKLPGTTPPVSYVGPSPQKGCVQSGNVEIAMRNPHDDLPAPHSSAAAREQSRFDLWPF